jgi:hypothetical protein
MSNARGQWGRPQVASAFNKGAFWGTYEDHIQPEGF